MPTISEARISELLPTGVGGPAKYPEGDRQDPLVYCNYVHALWHEQDEELRPLHQVWMRNLVYMAGHQWWEPGRDGRFAPRPTADWKKQPVSNKLVPYQKTFLAKVTKNRPAWQVVAASSEPEDIQSADLADKVLVAKWTELGMGRKYRRAVAWCIATGNAFLLPYWNTATGRMQSLEIEMEVPRYKFGIQVGTETVRVPCDENGDPKLAKNGRPVPGAKPHVVDEGDVDVKVYSPFQLRVNAEAMDDDDVTHFILADAMTLRELASVYGKAGEGIMADDVSWLEEQHTAFGNLGFSSGVNGRLPAGPHQASDRKLPKALVLHYHEKPTPAYPSGRYWVCTRDRLLVEPGPLPEGLWPGLVHMQEIVNPTRYYGDCTVTHLCPLNREYNEKNAQIQEYTDQQVGGKWAVAIQSGIKRQQITTQPFEVLRYNHPFKPERLELDALPPQLFEERDRVAGDFEEVSGIRKVSQGTPPPGVSAGIAIMQLQEADDTDLGPFLAMGEESIASLAASFLVMIQDNYDEPRMVQVVGPNRRYMVRAFKGSDLRGAVDVRAQEGSSFPWNRVAMQNMLLETARTLPQLFTDPESGQFDKAAFAEKLPIGGLESVSANDDLDVQEALREEQAFEDYGSEDGQLEVPQVEPWQNHDVHFRQHGRVLKSAAWKDWPQENQDLFKQHFAETVAARMNAKQMLMQMAGAPQGAPQGPPQGMPMGGAPGMDPGMPVPMDAPIPDPSMGGPGLEGVPPSPPTMAGPGGMPIPGMDGGMMQPPA